MKYVTFGRIRPGLSGEQIRKIKSNPLSTKSIAAKLKISPRRLYNLIHQPNRYKPDLMEHARITEFLKKESKNG